MTAIYSKAGLSDIQTFFFPQADGSVLGLTGIFGALGDIDVIGYKQFPNDNVFVSFGSFTLAVQEESLVKEILQSAILPNGQTVWNAISPPGAMNGATYAQIEASQSTDPAPQMGYVSPVINGTFYGSQAIDQIMQDYDTTHTLAQVEQATGAWLAYKGAKFQAWLTPAYASAQPASYVQSSFNPNPDQVGSVQNAEAMAIAEFQRILVDVNGNVSFAPPPN